MVFLPILSTLQEYLPTLPMDSYCRNSFRLFVAFVLASVSLVNVISSLFERQKLSFLSSFSRRLA